MAKLLNHLELNSTGNIWAKQVSQEEESSNLNSAPVSWVHGKGFQKFYKSINMCKHGEKAIHEADDITKRKKSWICRNNISTALLDRLYTEIKHEGSIAELTLWKVDILKRCLGLMIIFTIIIIIITDLISSCPDVFLALQPLLSRLEMWKVPY